MARVIDGASAVALAQAAEALAAGSLVAFPTETVYGLGARADDDAAVARIFAAKGRPSDHPLIVHVADRAGVDAFAASVPPSAERLMQAFWPGALTLILPRRAGVADAAAGGQDTIGVRCPAHPAAQALLRAAAARGVPGVAGPSANRFGRLSPTAAAHVAAEFGDEVLVLDGGECAVGIESAIVDCSRGAPALLRPGMVTRAQIETVLGLALAAPGADAPRAPGTLEAHYAPRAPLRLMSAAALRNALQIFTEAVPGPAQGPPTLAVYSRTVVVPAGVLKATMPAAADAAAHELFATLRRLDDAGARLIWVEEPPDEPPWEGVRDRLQRAARSA